MPSWIGEPGANPAAKKDDPITDLRARGVLIDPPLTPRYADDDAALARLAEAQRGITVLDLLSP